MNKKMARLILGFSLSMLSSVLAAVQAAPGAAPAAAPDDSGPRIVFATNVYDFGKIKAGDPVKFTYSFTNTGNEMLIITNVQPSCGCTTAGDWTHQVEPGKSGTIPIQFNSGNYNGTVVKTVTVTCNDKTQPTIPLQLKGTIWKPIDVNPQFAVMTIPAESVTPVKTVVHIVNNMDEPLNVFTPESNNKAFSAELQTNTPGKDYSVTITGVGPFEAPNLQGQITLKTSTTNTPTISITAWANVQQAIVVSPPQITLPAGPLPLKQTMTATIQYNGTNSLRLTEPTLDLKGVEVSLGETQPGKLFTATMNFPEGFEMPAGVSPQLIIKSSHPKYPEIKVPIAQLPRPVLIPQQPAAGPLTPVPITPAPHAAATTPTTAAKP